METTSKPPASALRIAVVGCCHGELDVIYNTIETACVADGGRAPDLVVICGDFQAVRHERDLECMACPVKYRAMGDFWQYYAGIRKAPVPTLVIGGNHEASAYFQSLPYGGMIAPNMFFMGYAGVVNFGGLRIAGISGIFDKRDYRKPHYESAPYDERSMRTVYHTRERDVWRLAQLTSPVDIMLSHDWPAGVDMAGDQAWLLKKKRFFAEDSAKGELGSPANWNLMTLLRPAFWFAAHLHVKFPAIVSHSPPQPLHPKMNRGWVAVAYSDLQMRPSAVEPQPAAPASAAASSSAPMPTPEAARAPLLRPDGYACTRFLALDKPMPGRGFVQVIDIDPVSLKSQRLAAEASVAAAGGGDSSATPPSEAAAPRQLCFDAEWSAVVQATHTTAMDPSAEDKLPFLAPLPDGSVQRAHDALQAAFGSGAPCPGGVPIPTAVRSTAPAFQAPEGFKSSYDAKAAALVRVRQGKPQPGDEHATEWGYPGERRPPPTAEGNAFTDEFLAALGLEHCGTVPAGWVPPQQPAPEKAAANAPSYSPDGTVTQAASDAPAATTVPVHVDDSIPPAAWKDDAEIDIDDL